MGPLGLQGARERRRYAKSARGGCLHCGKAPCFLVMDGHGLLMVLSEEMRLTDFLRMRMRVLAEDGRVRVPFSQGSYRASSV